MKVASLALGNVLLGIALLTSLAGAQSATAAPAAAKPAAELLGAAAKQAKAQHKAVFVRFTASWCGWCHRMESVLNSPEVKPIWDKYFVSQPIVVLENGDQKVRENPGGTALLEKVGGADQGIPYFYFVDPGTDKVIVNSLMPAANGGQPSNVGCPYEDPEIAFFMGLLSKAAPKMTAAERATIQAGFASLKKNEK